MKSRVHGMAAALMLGALAVSASVPAAAAYKIIKLVSDQAGVAPNTDPNLVNAWGLAQSGTGPAWVSDQGTGLSTVYNRKTGAISSIVVSIPMGGPTGIVSAATSLGFNIMKNGKTGAATFLFDTTSGAIEGWSSSVDPNNAVVAVTTSGAVYTGLALDSTAVMLYAANSTTNQIEAYNNKFQLQKTFTDPNVASGFSVYNVQDINGTLYVTYSKFGTTGGYVDTFDTSGNLIKELIVGSPLYEPWGVTMAPSSFGTFSNDLLVGNLGNGQINAFDPSTGAHLGTLKNKTGKALKIQGLWALDSGPGTNQVNFAAGPGGYAHGLFGIIQGK